MMTYGFLLQIGVSNFKGPSLVMIAYSLPTGLFPAGEGYLPRPTSLHGVCCDRQLPVFSHQKCPTRFRVTNAWIQPNYSLQGLSRHNVLLKPLSFG